VARRASAPSCVWRLFTRKRAIELTVKEAWHDRWSVGESAGRHGDAGFEQDDVLIPAGKRSGGDDLTSVVDETRFRSDY